ncbi:MAG: efflux RND transporter permease subunit, partial [Gammaproteobacteria bacterium]|nr:efflux RND transporter permease subunit [Gammaproteobacteria bacterium]
LDHMVDITSLINVSYLEPSDKALISRPLIGHNIPTDKSELALIRKTALAHPDYPLVWVSKDGEYGAMLIRTDFRTVKPKGNAFDSVATFDVTGITSSDVVEGDKEYAMTSPSFEEYTVFYHAIEKIIEQQQYSSHFEYYPIGGAPVNAYINDEMLPQINFWTMVSLLLIAVILWLLFRSFSALFWPILIIALSAVFMVATLGYLGIRMNMMINVVVLLIMAIGVADAIHIMSSYIYFRKQDEDHLSALRKTYRKSGLAVTLTSMTTAAGMLALLFVPLIPIQLFGLASALGVLFAFLLSVVMLPLMMNLWGPMRKNHMANSEHHSIQIILRKFEHWSHLYPTRNITVFSLFTVVLLYGALQIRVDTNFIELFTKDTPMRIAQETVEEKMGGTMALEIMLDSKLEEAMLKPVMLNAMDQLQAWLENEMGHVVVKTNSLVDVVKDSNRSLNSGQQSYYKIPQDANVLRQTLFMFNSANPRDRALLVSDDYRKTHITVVFKNHGSQYYIKMFKQIQDKIDDVFADIKTHDNSLKVTPTGTMVVTMRVIDYVSWSQINGFGIALLSISVILLLTFRSVRVGLVALYPNLLPIVMVFGIMGYAGIPLDTDTLLVAPILIGIVVDDTIHFLTHYRALMEQHDDIDRAIIGSFREVGQAITFTSLILIGAFVTFGFLDHNGLKNFGMLASLAMMTALAGDLLLLPALLKVTRTRFNNVAQTAQATT